MSKKIQIILINPPSSCVEDDRLEPPLGILYIIAMLRERSYDNIRLLDLAGANNELDINNAIKNIPKAEIYGIYCLSTTYNNVKRIIKTIKNFYPYSIVILGGAHPTAMPEYSLFDLNADSVIQGEGEITFCDLVDSYVQKGSLRKTWNKGKIHQDIDKYPFPARDIVDYNTYSRELIGNKVTSVISSRGCSNACVHCNSIIMGGGSSGVRFRSPKNLLSEIKLLKNDFDYFRFNDDNFTGHPEVEKILNQIKKLDIKFRIFAKLEDLTEKICELLCEAGCIHISIGLESLNPLNLKILGKVKTLDNIENIKNVNNNGLYLRSSFMVGLPYDTKENIKYYFKQIGNLKIHEFAIYPLIPYPGTRIWKYPEKYGYKIVNRDFSKYIQIGKNKSTVFALEHENFTSKDVQEFHSMATTILRESGMKHISESEVAK